MENLCLYGCTRLVSFSYFSKLYIQMDRLPTEILHSVFIQLPLRQRLECTLVCRYWSDLLRKRSLFHTVVMEEEDICDRFLEMIQRFPARAYQVEILRLDNSLDTMFDNRKICNIFPKARVIEITSGGIHDEFIHFNKRPVELIISKTQITHLADYDECELACELMNTKRCSRLKYLKICMDSEKDSSLHFVPQIKNLPMTLDHLETLHDNVPTLKTFTFDWFEPQSSILPLNIKPTLVTKLNIEGRGFDEQMDKQVIWLNYIQQKYPALTEFSFWCQYNENHDTVNMYNFYTLGVLPVMKSLGSQVVTTSPLCVPHGLDIFEHIDEYGCKLRECTFIMENSGLILEEMAVSAQTEHLQKLHIFYLQDSAFTWLPHLMHLKVLELTYHRVLTEEYDKEKSTMSTISLNTLLRQSPDTLETLSISFAELNLVYTNDTYASSSVKTLKLKSTVLPKGADKYLARYFPLLTSLHLEECIFSNGKLSLPNHNLSCLEVVTRDKAHAIVDVSLKTEQYVQPRLYPAKPQGLFMSLYQGHEDVYINPTDYQLTTFPDDIRTRVYLELEAASVKSLIVNRLQYSTC
ncbi:hypothetical protein K501DRAFT_273824 [Backusella circina FSU 941]|nr:hypothetical protein K501DRAFT_273824 [Backusella circina FSU 941]